MKKMLNQLIKAKRRAMIKGEMRMMGIKEKHHHIQECVKMFKEITPSITYLVVSKKGNH
jgi:alanine-alpha-ketoisovalerate/valine-pyruvate aminotransferase